MQFTLKEKSLYHIIPTLLISHDKNSYLFCHFPTFKYGQLLSITKKQDKICSLHVVVMASLFSQST